MGKIYKAIWKLSMKFSAGHRRNYLCLSLILWTVIGMAFYICLASTGVFSTGVLTGKGLEAGIIIIGYTAFVLGYLGAMLYAVRHIPSYYFRDHKRFEGTDTRPAHEQKINMKYAEDHADKFLQSPIRQQ